MKIVISDNRFLGAVVQRSDATYWNPKTGGYETPFDPTKHVIPFVAVDATVPAFATVQSADIGNELMQRHDVVALAVTLDKTTGAPTSAVDVFPQPTPWLNPTIGGLRAV